jgi:hypothetical protein
LVRESCERAEYVNIAVDGWSDPRGRRYQGVAIIPTDQISQSSLMRSVLMTSGAVQNAD